MEYLPVALYSNKGVIYDRTKIEELRRYFVLNYFYIDFVYDDMVEYCNNEVVAKGISKDSIDILDFDLAFDTWYLPSGKQIEHEKGVYNPIFYLFNF